MFRAFHFCHDCSGNIEKVSLQGKADRSLREWQSRMLHGDAAAGRSQKKY